MRIEIVTKNYQVRDNLEEMIQKKVNKLDKYFNEETKCKVYLKIENKTHKMEISLEHKGVFMRAQANGENFFDTLDVVIPKLESQIYKHRSILESKLKKGINKDISVFADVKETKAIELVKTKQFELSPMSVKEAIDEFELLGHTFYIFLDKDSKTVKVLYQRDDGNLGLIEPIF